MKRLIRYISLFLFSSAALFASCSSSIGNFYINEMNTKGNWVEIYAKTPVSISGWSLKACTIERQGNSDVEVCETVFFSYSYDTDGYFKVLDFNLAFHDKANDFVLYDSTGAIVDYFRVGMELAAYPLQISQASACGLDTTCNIYAQGNNGQRDFARIPDGGCSWKEDTWTNYTKDTSNTGSPLPPPVQPLNYAFDAWDTFRTLADRNISTKKVSGDFSLTLAALNEANDALQDINGTVCSQVVDKDNGNLAKSTWVKSLFQNQSTATISFNISDAVKNSGVNIVWKKDVDAPCPLGAGDGETLSSDNFAIRPDRFYLTPSAPYYAGEAFGMLAYANDLAASPSSAYNESYGVSFVIEGNETRAECITGLLETLSVDAVSFANGLTPVFNATFPGIADLNISIHEISGSEFSRVDIDDTADALRYISPYETAITVGPYELNVSSTQINTSTGDSWIYMADLRDINISLRADIQANNKQHQKLIDFNSTCYAKDVNVTFGALSDGAGSLDMNYSAVLGVFDDGSAFRNASLQEINQTMTIAAAGFVGGVGSAEMALNVDRNISAPILPFYIGGLKTEINTADIAYTENNNTDLIEGDVTLYYGRLRANDIVTTLPSISNPLFFEVYDSTSSVYTQGMSQSSLFWYINGLHTGDLPGNVIEATASENMIIDNVLSGFSFVYPTVSAGKETLSITSNISQKATIHLKTQPWLWYVPSALGSVYNDAAGSDCTMHPCFKYSLTTSNPLFMIKSGEYNGTVVPDEDRGDYIRKGVKLFR